jgi:hypothetical protein
MKESLIPFAASPSGRFPSKMCFEGALVGGLMSLDRLTELSPAEGTMAVVILHLFCTFGMRFWPENRVRMVLFVDFATAQRCTGFCAEAFGSSHIWTH